MTKTWDNPGIKAEVERRGYTLTSLAKSRGLSENACRRALSSSCLPGAQAIADLLGVKVEELFPGRYLRQHRHTATPATPPTSPKCGLTADTGVAA